MHNIILIKRYLPSSYFWPNLLKDKRIAELTVEEILNKYQGFEGELIAFLFCDSKPDKIVKKEINELSELKKLENCLLLHVISGNEVMLGFLKEEAFCVGYDVGVCEEEKTIYSSIFNEVLFGHLDELVVYKELLNEHLLFRDKNLAEKYVSLHNELSAQGKGVEDYEEMTIYEIRKHKS